MNSPCRAAALAALIALVPIAPARSQTQPDVPSGAGPGQVARYSAAPVPLLSMESLSFLEGRWTASTRDGRQQLGVYTWARELNGHILARHADGAAACSANTAAARPSDASATAACGRQDLLYIFQDSAGAPLQAIYFDAEGHVIRYSITMQHLETPNGGGRRDFAIFLSDPNALGPRYRLTYERSTDTVTGATTLAGIFEVLLANNQWRTHLEWFGRKV